MQCSRKLCLLKNYQCECYDYIYIFWKISPEISYCAKYSTIEANDSLTFSLEILKDINCTADALKVSSI